MNDRYPGFDNGDHSYYGPHDQEHFRSPGTGGSYRGSSSARDYAAAGYRGGERDRSDRGDRGYRGGYDSRGAYGGRDEGRGYDGGYGGFTGSYRPDDRSDDRGYGARGGDRQDRYRDEGRSRGGGGRRPEGYGSHDDRGFLARAGDEVRSWFGDEEAERRREYDMRQDEERMRRERFEDSQRDDHYRSWRNERVSELDRDYDEYRNEHRQRFQSEFTNWRTERQGQRDSLGRVTEHMEVVGSDGGHVGTVDKVRGDRIVLTKNDTDAGGHHHSIPSRWIQTVDDKVTIRKTADEAKAAWKDEERGAMFGSDDDKRGSHRDRGNDWSSDHNLNKSFSGTY